MGYYRICYIIHIERGFNGDERVKEEKDTLEIPNFFSLFPKLVFPSESIYRLPGELEELKKC